LPEADLNRITLASSTALFIPEPGRMYLFNPNAEVEVLH
jgi:hypothetical protein